LTGRAARPGDAARFDFKGADHMSESNTYKIVEIAGTSPDGVTEAMRSGLKRAAQTLRDVDWIQVESIRGHVEGDEIAHFQVVMKIGFRLEPRQQG
jgi:dodecin